MLDVDQASTSIAISLWDCSIASVWFACFCMGLRRSKSRVRSGAPVYFRSQLDYRGRIMTYVLIVVSWLGGAVNGAAVSTQEFASVERCEAARLALVADAKARALEDQLRPICLQK